METLTVRLLPYRVADGPWNMAADATLLRSAREGIPSLRFYGWSEATLSLGYFQAEASRKQDSRLAVLPFVRRSTGGSALVHHHELTYCVALRNSSNRDWLKMHEVIASALAAFHVHTHPQPSQEAATKDGPLCFRHFTSGDLMIGNAKIVGSAQRKQHGAIMQHGGILLARSPFAPSLPGIKELCGITIDVPSLCDEIGRQTSAQLGWAFKPGDWSKEEIADIERGRRECYGNDDWNGKR